jgi:hypothetical protein
VPLHAGEPEHPSVKQLEEAVYLGPSAEDLYDYLEALGQDPTEHIGGAASDSYIRKYGTLGLIAEIPYWADAAAADSTPTGDSYIRLIRAHAAGVTATVDTLQETLTAVTPDLVTNSPFLRASRSFIQMLSGLAATHELRSEADDRIATVAEVAWARDRLDSVRLRFGGILLRALEAEIAVGNGTPVIRERAHSLAGDYAAWSELAETGSRVETIPIRHLVAIQYGAVLAGASHA